MSSLSLQGEGRGEGARLVSLDAFRGFTIAAMVLVNNPGDWGHLYSQLAHAQWNGWTFTDWIFPFFLFICGVSMAYSLQRRAAGGAGAEAMMGSLARRGAIIIAIGLLLNLFPYFDFAHVRIPGVLQRIGLCVILAAPLAVLLDGLGVLLWIFGLLVLYAVVMLFVPVPDPTGAMAAGALAPGRDAGAYLDRMLLGGHLWSRSKTWDPEGLLSTLPAVATLLWGVMAGRFLLAPPSPAEKTVWMMIAGLLALWLGAILDVVVMPINKSLWSVSYCIFMTGWALLVFAPFYWLMDAVGSARIRGQARALLLPFTIYGMNALFIFAFSGLVARILGLVKVPRGDATVSLKAWLYGPIQSLPMGPFNASLVFAVLFNLAMFAVAWFMWKKKWFVKV